MPHLTTVLNALQRRPDVLEHLGTRSHQVDHSLVIAERPGHRVWNVARITGLLGRFKDRRAGTIEYADDRGSLGRALLTILLGHALCRRNGDKCKTIQNGEYASHRCPSAHRLD